MLINEVYVGYSNEEETNRTLIIPEGWKDIHLIKWYSNNKLILDNLYPLKKKHILDILDILKTTII